MQTPFHHPLKNAPGAILGYRRTGAAIRAIAGGSESIPEGTTIAVPAEPPPPPPTPNTISTNGTPSTGAQIAAQMFTVEDIERARQQEKDKLYERISKSEELLKSLQRDRDDRFSKEEKARKEAEAAAEAERQKNLTFEQKLTESNTTWEQRLASMQQQIEQRDALLEAERRFQSLQEFRGKRLQEETENIMPEMHAWIAGGSEEEIEESISRAKETTASILDQVAQMQQGQQQAQQQARQQARGTSVTAPPVGPSDNQTDYETFSVDDLRNMDMNTYAKNRARLLNAASNQMRGRG